MTDILAEQKAWCEQTIANWEADKARYAFDVAWYEAHAEDQQRDMQKFCDLLAEPWRELAADLRRMR